MSSNLRIAAQAIVDHAQPANYAADWVMIHRTMLGRLRDALQSSDETTANRLCPGCTPYVWECGPIDHEPTCTAVKVTATREPSPAETEGKRELSATEAASFDKAFSRSPRRVDETTANAANIAGTLEVAGDPTRLALIAACRQLVGATADMTGWPHFLSVPRQLVGNLREALYDAEHPERSQVKASGESSGKIMKEPQ